MTDALGTLAYTIINYDKLAYDAADLNGNTVTGRCQVFYKMFIYLFKILKYLFIYIYFIFHFI